MSRTVVHAGLIGAAVGLMACGGTGASRPGPGQTTPRVAPRPPQRLTAATLERQMGGAFATGLDRLIAVRTGTNASDLGQRGTAGVVRSVACSRPAAHDWQCTVRWRTAARRPRVLRYAAHDDGRGCFVATAVPRLTQTYDTEQGSPAEDPRDVLTAGLAGC